MPKVNTATSPNSSRLRTKVRYSVLAGSITINGIFLPSSLLLISYNSLWQVVVLPLPVTPATNICLLRILEFNKKGISSSTRPFCTTEPMLIASSLSIGIVFSPKPTDSLSVIPGTSFCGKPASRLTSLAVRYVPAPACVPLNGLLSKVIISAFISGVYMVRFWYTLNVLRLSASSRSMLLAWRGL